MHRPGTLGDQLVTHA